MTIFDYFLASEARKAARGDFSDAAEGKVDARLALRRGRDLWLIDLVEEARGHLDALCRSRDSTLQGMAQEARGTLEALRAACAISDEGKHR